MKPNSPTYSSTLTTLEIFRDDSGFKLSPFTPPSLSMSIDHTFSPPYIFGLYVDYRRSIKPPINISIKNGICKVWKLIIYLLLLLLFVF